MTGEKAILSNIIKFFEGKPECPDYNCFKIFYTHDIIVCILGKL
jgi:hypothetical protein